MDAIYWLFFILTILSVLLCVILLITLIIKLNSFNSQNMSNIDDKIEKYERRLSSTIQTSVKNLGDIIISNQKNTDQMQVKNLTDMGNNIAQKQDALNKSIVSMLNQSEIRFKTFESTNEQKLNAMRDTIEKRLSYIQEDNNKKLDSMREMVNDKLQKTLEDKMTNSFKLVNDRLEQVYKGLGEMQSLASGVSDLKKVLSNVKTRGILGEIQLGAILKEILSPEQYEENIELVPKSNERVEFAVKLPGDDEGPVYLPIDSKFPSDAFASLQDAYNMASKEMIDKAFAELASRIKRFAKEIHDKYIKPPYTTEFAIMFLPFEGLYSEVVNRGLVEILQHDYHINVAGPSTMAALLNSLQMGFKTVAIQKRSSEVWKILSAVKTEFDKFDSVLSDTRLKLEQANDRLDKLVGVRTRAIQRKLRDVEKLEQNEADNLLEEHN